jgi:hypothetical protein
VHSAVTAGALAANIRKYLFLNNISHTPLRDARPFRIAVRSKYDTAALRVVSLLRNPSVEIRAHGLAPRQMSCAVCGQQPRRQFPHQDRRPSTWR